MTSFASTRDLQQKMKHFLEKAKEGPVIITKHGRPCAALVLVEENNITDFLSKHDGLKMKGGI